MYANTKERSNSPVNKQRPVDLGVVLRRVEDADFSCLVDRAAGQHSLGNGEGVEDEAVLAMSLSSNPTINGVKILYRRHNCGGNEKIGRRAEVRG